MSADHEKDMLTPKEQRFIKRLTSNYTPAPSTATQRAVFTQDLQERIARYHRPLFFRPVVLAATACAAAVIWLASGEYRTGPRDQQQAVMPRVETEQASNPEENSLLLFAYEDTELYGDDDDDEQDSFLPDEYEALTTILFPADV